MSRYYPVFLELQNREVLVVGGGAVALRKVKSLLEHGASVRIVSPAVCPELQQLIDQDQCCWLEKEYGSDDIGQAVLVFACTDQEKINLQVAEDAQSRCKQVNVVNDSAQGSFIVPSSMERGDLKIAVSTSGISPLVARSIRLELEQLYGVDMERYLKLLGRWRKIITQSLPKERRERFWAKVTDGEVLSLIRNQEIAAAEGVIEACFQSLSD